MSPHPDESEDQRILEEAGFGWQRLVLWQLQFLGFRPGIAKSTSRVALARLSFSNWPWRHRSQP